MDLVAGETREILLAIALDDWAGLRDVTRFDGHLALGGGLDPSWLDRFAAAVRDVLGGSAPGDFTAACRDLEGPADVGERTVERVSRDWIDAVARIPDGRLDAIGGRWIDLLHDEVGEAIEAEEKAWIRGLAGDLVAFARRADRASDVLFAWSI